MRILNFLKKACNKPYVASPGAIPPSWEPYKQYIDIHPTALIAPSATVQFYNLPTPPRIMLKIGEMSHVFGHFAFVRDCANITLGARCQIGNSHFIAADNIAIGDDVLMAWGINVIDSDTHALNWQSRKMDAETAYGDYLRDPVNMIASKNWDEIITKPVFIGDRSWIGFNATILKGVTLGPESIVGAASVITKSFNGNCKIAGNPARTIP